MIAASLDEIVPKNFAMVSNLIAFHQREELGTYLSKHRNLSDMDVRLGCTGVTRSQS
jgi:hypothetical protein